MANTINQLTKRGASILLGLLMLVTSLMLIINVHISISQILYTFNPYPFYFIGVIFGFERLFYGITGSSRLLNLLNGEVFSFGFLSLFLLFLTFGLYISIYTIAFTQIFIQILNAFNGISYLLYSLMIFKAWHM